MAIKKYLPMVGLALALSGTAGSCHYGGKFREVQNRPHMQRLAGYQNIVKSIDSVVASNSSNQGDKALSKVKGPVISELKRLYRLPEVQAGEAEIESIIGKAKLTSYAFLGGFGLWFIGSVLNRRREE
jgi:hypothetical protein